MGQLLFRKAFSVGTKLLLSVLLLIAVVVAFLNVSAIILLKEDKQAYVFQSKLTEAVLAGNEFVNTVRHVFDTLRLSVATVDPRKPVTPELTAVLAALVENQSDAIYLSVGLFDLTEPSFKVVARSFKQKKLEELRAEADEFALSDDWLRSLAPDLKKNGFAFVNLSKSGISSLLGVLHVEGRAEGKVPVAFAVVPLKQFGSELSALNLTIATRSGWILFDTDATAQYSRSSVTGDPLFAFASQNSAANGTHEFVAGGTRYLGSYVFPGFDLMALSRVEWAKAHRATYALTEKFILLGLIAIGAAILFTIFFARTLTAPIAKLYEATKEVGKGHFNLNLAISSDDEIGELTRSFNSMSQKINELFIESVEKVKLENEIDIASTVQQTLLPPPVFSTDHVDIHSFYQAASRCGGDWWGTFTVGNRVVVGIADATGHGLPCALITASAKSCFSFLRKLAEENPTMDLDPGAMLSVNNRVIYEATEGRIMMTFFIAVLDFDKGEIRYANAGHNPPWLFRDEGGKIALRSLSIIGQRLGETADLPIAEVKTMDLRKGDLILLYTDGLMEGKGANGEMFGKRRMRATVESNFAAGPKGVVTALVNDFTKHGKDVAQEDDVTIAAIHVIATPATVSPERTQVGAEAEATLA
ncbi:MAG: SpoIIE family protein phosphatase [Oligoflexia bacterium]|nr:SpoIIE family protein phosphatase [Oligoflexia bacterium]